MQTLDYVSGLHNFRAFSKPSECLDLGYVNTEKVLYCFYKIILKNTSESKTSQPCLHTPNANMADHSVAARGELYESEASEASVFCFLQCFSRKVLLRRRSGLFHFALTASFVFLNATRRE